MKHLKYLRYIVKHKWCVFCECWKRGLIWRGVIHDWSKFLPSEWFPYVENFYGKKPIKRDETGYYKPTDVSPEFDRAWLHHIHHNAHHWQHWLLVQDEDDDKVLPIPRKYLVEMLCDWKGAGRAQDKPDTIAWYEKNKNKMIMDEHSRSILEAMLWSPSLTRKDVRCLTPKKRLN